MDYNFGNLEFTINTYKTWQEIVIKDSIIIKDDTKVVIDMKANEDGEYYHDKGKVLE